MQLGHRGFEIDSLATAGQPSVMIEHVPRTLDPQLHVHDLTGDLLILTDRMPALPALVGITNTSLEQALHRPDRRGQDATALPGHRAGKEKSATAFLAEQVFHRHLAVL